jgi:hypothetical protein
MFTVRAAKRIRLLLARPGTWLTLLFGYPNGVMEQKPRVGGRRSNAELNDYLG